MVDPVSIGVTTAASLGKALAVETFKGRAKTMIEKLGRSDAHNLDILVIRSALVVSELESLNSDFLDAIHRNPSMEASKTFLNWSSQVSETVPFVRTFINHHKHGKKKPIVLPEWYTKEMKNKTAQMLQHDIVIDQLLKLSHRFDRDITSFSVPRPPEKVLKIPNVHQLAGFPSFAKPWKDALKLLKSSQVKSVAISGPFGVGKRMFLCNLNNCEEVAERFDMVIFLDGSDVESDANLLEAIARRIKLHQDTQITAESVSLELSKYPKCLLLLDDVRKVSTQLKMPPGSKVVLTVRSEFKKTCQPFVDTMIAMPPSLPRIEAWQMFQAIVGEDDTRDPGIEREAMMVSNLCGGIYFVITTIAIHFKENITADLSDKKQNTAAFWRNELRKLKKEKTHKMKGMEEVYNYWRSCYDQLKDNIRNCFLYAALHPPGRKIRTQHLIETWTEEGLINSNAKSMTRCEMLDKGQVVLRKLTDLAFLDKHGESIMFVEMRRSIHEFVMHVQAKGVIVKTGTAESPTLDDWRIASRISMVDNSVCKLPDSTGCENLLTLLLQRNSTLTIIPPSFFQLMNKLVLLDLYKTGIVELPSSVSNLVALKALYLNGCDQLMVLPADIKKLESLEVLDIRDTEIYYIPEHIWSLLNLKCLRTSYTGTPPLNQKEVKDHNVVLGLPVLEELVIYVKSYQDWCKEINHIIRLVAGMKSLTNLKFCFPNAEAVKTFLAAGGGLFDQLSSFHIYVGCENNYCPETTKRLEHDGIVQYLRYCQGKNDEADTIRNIVARSQALELLEHKEITRLSDLGAESFTSVHNCVIGSCDNVVTVSAGSIDTGKMLPRLQKLYFTSMKSLKGVLEDKELSHPWGLQVLELKGCPKLTKIVSQGVLEKLHKLTTLVIEDCGKIQKLIPQPRGSEVQVLPALQTLRLLNLRKLRTICADKRISWPSLEVLEINGCPQLKKLPISKDRAPRLCVFKGEQLQKWMATAMN